MIAELICLAVAGYLMVSAVTHTRRWAAILLAFGSVLLMWMSGAGFLLVLGVGAAAVGFGVWRVKHAEAKTADAKAVA